MVLIGIPLTLIAILGAMHLLAKAQKEGLHDIFKYTSYFVLTLCVFTLSLFLIKAFDKGKHHKDRFEKHIEIMKKMHEDHGHGKDMMFFRHHDDGPMTCPHSDKEGCCMKDGMMEKEIIVKDTIIKK